VRATNLFNTGGNSVVMELGYAYPRRKPIYALASVDDLFLSRLVAGFVSPDKLMELVA
jgi:hypothetical protein